MNSQYDDLTAIKGIKETRQQWLRDTFHIRTFSDLAALDVNEIEAKLKAERQISSRTKIEGWIAEAKHFAENPDEAAAILTAPRARQKLWKPLASFVVEFQERDSGNQQVEWRTTVQHIEEDSNKTWAGIEQHELCHWMAEQLGEQLPTLIEVTAEAEVNIEHERIEHIPSEFAFLEKMKGHAAAELETVLEDLSPLISHNARPFSAGLQDMLHKATFLDLSSNHPPTVAEAPAAQQVNPLIPQQITSNPVTREGFSDKLRRKIDQARRLTTG